MQNKIKKLFSQHKTNSLLFTSTTECFYLAKSEFDGFWILAVKDKVYVLSPKMILNQVKKHFEKTPDKVCVCEVDSFSQTLCKILKQFGAKNILVDSKYISASNFFSISKKLSKENIKLITKDGVLDKIRIVKCDEEIENIKTACRIVSQVCDEIKVELKAGLTELDIHYRILEFFAKNKVYESFTPIVASGKNSANPHHRSSDRKVKENDIVLIDIGCVYKGYCSDLTRTYFLGKIPEIQKNVWNIVKKSQKKAILLAKAGVFALEIDNAARGIISDAGYKENFIHTTGHGVGVEIHESPRLSAKTKERLQKNFTVTIEPGIYLNGQFGVRIEDTVLIKNNNCEVLTSAVY
ncbi:MAG: aminopeptidase P family protein [Elusimicrobiota bacterium]|jgi:Xaa-Pro aminopeptidase|nr:aminopeptidase P family protein [Elusimicrobiota bacterium]